MKVGKRPDVVSTDLGLVLANGERWSIRALDERAATVVRELGKVMQLGPARGGHELCAVSDWKSDRGWWKAGAKGRRVIFRLGSARDWRAKVLRMERIATAVAEQSLAKGTLLLHGALITRDGAGFVLAGASGVGKSTACRRLPPIWQALSDDCVLVVRNRGGGYMAHPWPTWSFLRDNGPGASWPVEPAVPLRALFFLRQSGFDRAEPVGLTPALALTMESAYQLARAVVFTPEPMACRALCARYLKACRDLCAAVPSYRLDLSLRGHFWNAIERVGNGAGPTGPRPEAPERKPQSPRMIRLRTRAPFQAAVPHRLLLKARSLKLIRFQARQRSFLKVMRGRRVVATVNDVMRGWHIPSRTRLAARGRGRKIRPDLNWTGPT